MTDAGFSQRLARPVDLASLAVFRALFGGAMFFGTLRFLLSGWVRTQYVEPAFFFKYWGFEWTVVWPAWGMYLHFAVLAALALCVGLGLFYRVAMPLFCLAFAYVQLLDVTNYLNHYYFVVLMAAVMSLMPLSAKWSLDAWLFPHRRAETIPTWMLWLVRLQVAVVYVHAGLAKANADWLLHAQPLSIWLSARTETPVLGALFAQPWAPWLMSWAGFLFDTTIVGFLMWRRTRVLAYAVVIAFHFMTHVLFDIGMFPVLMVLAAQVFFEPHWPRRWLRRTEAVNATPEPRGLPRWAVPALAAYAAFQLLFPLRSHLYPGTVHWGEQGMRFSWKVMLREKNGSVTFHVTSKAGRTWQVNPSQYLALRQANEMSSQPDLILQLAHHIAEDFRKRGHGEVAVRAEAWVSLNGRKPALLIDPAVDLTHVHDGVATASWILPPPTTPPLRPTAVAAASSR